jgi:hypothetical protein
MATASLAALALVMVAAGGAVARDQELITIRIDIDTGAETFTTHSDLLCPSGVAVTSFERGAGFNGAAGSFHLTKTLTCADGSGSFTIRVDAAINFVVGDGTTGGWSVVPGSGTEAYVGLKGGGSLVGVNVDEPPVDLVDHYYGSLRR